MGKRWLAMALAGLMLLSGCGKSKGGDTSTPAPSQPAVSAPAQSGTDPVLDDIQEQLAADGSLCAVASLGYVEATDFSDIAVYVEANGFGDEYPFLLDVGEDHFASLEGGELYAVVPADDSVTVTVHETFMDENNDYMPTVGEEVLSFTDGQPLLLRCNVSEIVPNVLLTLEKDGTTVEYSPCMSMRDGSLETDEGIMDITSYGLLEQLWGGYEPEAELFFLGTWFGRALNTAGDEMALELYLNPDGSAEYLYGDPYADILERFTGSWVLDEDGLLTLDLYGGPCSYDGSLVSGDSYEITSSFRWDLQGWALVMEHVDGNALIYGLEGSWMTFLPFDAHAYSGSWISDVQAQDWYYRLDLLTNAECSFEIIAGSGALLARYEGWWTLDGGNITLNMGLSEGKHPESPGLEYISGTYYPERWEESEMSLTFVYGEILTLNMEETTMETFFLA